MLQSQNLKTQWGEIVMSMRKLLIVACLLCSAVFNAHSVTTADCRSRVNNSIDNAGVLGGTDTDKLRWAQHAADECYKEAARATSDSSGAGIGTLIIALLMLAGGVFWLRILWEEMAGPKTAGKERLENAQRAKAAAAEMEKLEAAAKVSLDERLTKLRQQLAEYVNEESQVIQKLEENEKHCESLVRDIAIADPPQREKKERDYIFERDQNAADLRFALTELHTQKKRCVENIKIEETQAYRNETSKSRGARRLLELEADQRAEVEAIIKRWDDKLAALEILSPNQRGSKKRAIIKKKEEDLSSAKNIHERHRGRVSKIYASRNE